jgi:hypothetical protein
MTPASVKTRHHLLACVAITCSSHAFARGGPAGAFASMLEVFLVLAIVAGLVAGVLYGLALRTTPWKTLAILFVVALVAAFSSSFEGIFLGIPALVLLAVFASTSYLVKGGAFRPRLASTSTTPPGGEPQGFETDNIPNVLRWVAATYTFWVCVSLANFELLSFLVMPPAILWIAKFLPFILPPLVVALVVGGFVTAAAVKRSLVTRYMAPFVFNVCVLLAFLVSADAYRYFMMSLSLLDHKPNHLQCSSFTSSVLTYRQYFRGPHASFDENGKTYRWSYSERRYFQTP